MSKSTIFGEENFLIHNLATEFHKEMIEYRDDKIIGRIACDFLLDKDKVRRQLELCAKLENIDKTDLIDMATKKKIADKDYEIKELEKALELACGYINCLDVDGFECNGEKNCIDCHNKCHSEKHLSNYFKQKANQ